MRLSSLNRNIRRPGAAIADVAQKDGGTDMKTRFPNDSGILVIELAKIGFQVCVTASGGEAPYNRKFSRSNL